MFTEEYLDLNGVFLLWLISLNAGELVTGDLVSSLWDLFEARVSSKSGPPIMIMSCGNQLDANVLKEHKFYDDDSMSPSVHSLPDSTSKHTFQSESAKQGAQRFTPQAFLPNRIPPYCTIPKRRTTKCRAPEVPCSIPLLTTLPRKKHWGSFKTNPDVILASASVNPESAINFQAASCSFDSSLDSIV
ncbi:unnamed protein product [Calicophoron daubneyi]|uniref:Uncharacterized protein n=1 Tax=Calicophoron daubneyi TaxID=300641 RepID=A0AAV2T0E0_CALDB